MGRGEPEIGVPVAAALASWVQRRACVHGPRRGGMSAGPGTALLAANRSGPLPGALGMGRRPAVLERVTTLTGRLCHVCYTLHGNSKTLESGEKASITVLSSSTLEQRRGTLRYFACVLTTCWL